MSDPTYAEHRRASGNRRSFRHGLRRFGMTEEEYDAMAAGQSGVCAICRRPEPEGRRLHVDHDHKTHRVRGLLCGPCNRGIGMLNESVEVLTAAIAYLQQGENV